ncbi:MAG: hypothetical protein QXJ97_12585 [Desulfurococcaceae archaeon]
MSEQKILIEYYRKNLKYPGLSISIVIDEETLQQLEPILQKRSKSGAHGEDIYVVSRPVLVLRYSKSNSGKIRWGIYEVTPTSERKIKYSELPTSFQNAIKAYAKYYGLELNFLEEE